MAKMTTILSDPFGHWLAGFIDGEGCFHIKRVGSSFVCTFIIGVRKDDTPILEEIRDWTGLGDIYIVRQPGATVRWEVARKDEVRRLVDLLDGYPLRAKKARDFAIWREAVTLWQRVIPRQKADWGRIERLKAALERGRRHPDEV